LKVRYIKFVSIIG